MADWSTLYFEILGEILGKIDDWEEFAYFSIVCRSWYQAYVTFKHVRSTQPKVCLLLAENTEENPDCRRKILDVNNNRCYQLKLPQTFRARCWGSACGWIVTSDLDRQLLMVNPFTKVTIRLPPQQTVPNLTTPLKDDDEDARYMRDGFITKSIVLQDTQSQHGDYVVLASTGFWKKLLAFARPGDPKWTSVDALWAFNEPLMKKFKVPFNHRVIDIACCGTRAIILYADGSLGYIDISDICSSKQPVKAKVYVHGPPKGIDKRHFISSYNTYMYLVESLGDLLIIIRLRENYSNQSFFETYDEGRCYATKRFEVYRLKPETKEWEPLTKLGNVALYVGVSHSISVHASGSGSCKPNCIYFTDDRDDHWKWSDFGGHDMGVFDLETQKTETFYNGDDLYSKHCPPLWFVPDEI